MPAPGVIKLLDANVWLALVYSDHVHHDLARTWFDTQQEGETAFCRITQLALLRHLTNATIMGAFVQSQESAWQDYDELLQDHRVQFLHEPDGFEDQFRTLTSASTPSHRAWTDAYLAAFSIAGALQMVTLDRNFRRFEGLNLHIIG